MSASRHGRNRCAMRANQRLVLLGPVFGLPWRAERSTLEEVRKMRNLVGQVFGKLTVLSFHGKAASGSDSAWWCRCECGREKPIRGGNLRSGGTQSCRKCPNKVDHAGGGVTVVWLERRGGKDLIPCLIDTADYPAIKTKRWCVKNDRTTLYAKTNEQDSNVVLLMHQFLFPSLEQGSLVDHRNGNGLDNRRRNLRVATQAQNCQNKRVKQNTCGFKGVFVSGNKFMARIRINGKLTYLGTFDTAIAAARAFNEAAKKCHGEFAWTNDLGDVSDVVLNGIYINGPLRGKPVE
jgi:hypothetical protein